jgi:flagellar motor component MotA
MKLTERLNVLIQATSLSQKSGVLSLDDAVKAKTAIDIISSGTLNQNYAAAINVLIEIAVMSQKKGVYSLKDAYMIYLAINGIENEIQNEANRRNEEMSASESQAPHVLNDNDNEENGETIVSVPQKPIKKKRDTL